MADNEETLPPVEPLPLDPPAPVGDPASPLPEDRIDAFTSYSLAADLLELRELYSGFFDRVTDDQWARRTERRPEGWTLQQTLAHLGIIADVYHQAILDGLEERPVVVPGLSRREDLRAANQAALAELADLSPLALKNRLLYRLTESARLAASLPSERLALRVQVPFLSSPASIAELFGTSLIHAGIIHAAQTAVGARRQPIWLFYRPDLMRRQITRYIHAMGLSYWPERGGQLHAIFAIDIAGQGGGSWFVRVGPEGGSGQIGVVRTANVRLGFASADLFCRVFTVHTRLLPHLFWRRMKVKGNLLLARRMGNLFNPT